MYITANSPQAFINQLAQSEIQTYTRNQILAGVYFPNSKLKIRLKNLGFDNEQILLLSKSYQRLKQREERQKTNQEQTLKINQKKLRTLKK